MERNSPARQEMQFQSLGWEMATHSSILAWRTPRTEKPGGLQSTGSQTVRHDLVTKDRNKQINSCLLADREEKVYVFNL